MIMPHHILVTGASGFIGRHVVAALAETGVQVTAISRRPPAVTAPGVRWIAADCLDGTTDDAVRAAKADTLAHLAWTVEHGRFWTAPDNLDWTAATLKLARTFADAGGRRIVGVGSCIEYALENAIAPLSERTSALGSGFLYGIAKDATRRVLEGFGAGNGIEIAWARLFHLYGPGEDARRLVSSVAVNLLKGEPANCSSGRQQRDFMHVADAGAAIAALALSRTTGPVNIASGEATTIGHVVRALGDLAARPDLVRLGALADRPGDPPCILADVARLTHDVGFRPRYTLATGLAHTLAWWRQALENEERKQ